MIKPNELRLSNYVLLNGTYVTIKSISENRCEILQKTKRSACNYDEIEGIPLTSEWLLKFGFEKKPKNTFKNIVLPYYCLNGVCLFFNESPPDNTYLMGYGFNHGSDYYVATARWVDSAHELQNYYYALTGEELTIQE